MPGGCGYSQGARDSDQNDLRVERDLDVPFERARDGAVLLGGLGGALELFLV